ncbi:insulin-like growth factor-binding protein complex acid labile subunit, partial [Culicoides brevitarsis]|uniref:insulin-like growth factor-binding protein complex acid labile subunit n=1 Tax=Culicoides brevitarsis TaxID=469753 RepID=UPI00307BD250
LSNLLSLNLNNNLIQHINPLAFSGLGNLRELNLGDNHLEEIHQDVFKNLGKLQYLDLSNNRFKTLNQQIVSSNENLLRFNLNDNQIEALDLQVPPKLKKLEVTNNELKNVTLVGNGTLKSLQASGNAISDLQLDLDIEHLDLNYNQMESLEPLLHLNLTSLHLSENPLENLTGIKKLVKLKNLWLDRISTKFSSHIFASLTNLKSLSLSQSQISTFEVEPLKNLKKLVSLDLSNDEIKTLDYKELAKLPSFKRLILNFRAFNCSYFTNMSDYLHNKAILMVDGGYSDEENESYYAFCNAKETSSNFYGIVSFFVIFGIIFGAIILLGIRFDWNFNTTYRIFRNSGNNVLVSSENQ